MDWNRQSRDELRTPQALEIEALEEKILATHEVELIRLNQQLQRIEEEAAQRKL